MALLLPLLLPRIALILCALVTMAIISFVAGFGWCATAIVATAGSGMRQGQGCLQTQVNDGQMWTRACHRADCTLCHKPPQDRLRRPRRVHGSTSLAAFAHAFWQALVTQTRVH